jgi:citrate synthase
MSTVEKPKAGLEDTVATSSAICYLDGDRGVLAYCGYDIHDLARHATFEEVCYLLWHRRLPTRAELGDLQSALVAARPLPEGVQRLLRTLPAANGMDLLRTLTSALGHYDPDANDQSPQANYRKAVRLTAQISSLVAMMGRLAKGEGPIDPDPVLGHAANFLYMLTGERPSGLATHAFDVALTLHADHELNASTFAARVAAATLTDIHSTIVGAIGALKGPLHGGAPGPVLDMLDAIGEPEHAEAWLRAELAAGRRIMGMGHRVYRVRDPRAAVLERAVRELAGHAHEHGRLTLARAVEDKATEVLDAAYPERKLRANVEFFTAVLLEAVGLDRRLFTATFAVGRVAGWCGHVIEQRSKGRLIRPASCYVGPMPD